MVTYKTIDEMLSNEGFDSDCDDCPYFQQDPDVGWIACDAGCNDDCYRMYQGD